jgi:hypothetical protein
VSGKSDIELQDGRNRLTWDCLTPAPFESMWSLLVKMQILNLVSFRELTQLGILINPKSSAGRLFAGHSEWDTGRIATLLKIDVIRVLRGFSDYSGFLSNNLFEYDLRHCAQCRELGYHCAFFNLHIVSSCPWHNVPLSRGCSKCRLQLMRWDKAKVGLDAQWTCSGCGFKLDYTLGPAINRLPKVLQEEMERHCLQLVVWWQAVLAGAGDASSLVELLGSAGACNDDRPYTWRLSWATSLAEPPRGWGIKIPIDRASPSLRIRLLGNQHKKGPIYSANAFKRAKIKIETHFVRTHKRCLSEILDLSQYERMSLETTTLCTVCVAYLSWLASCSGKIPCSEQSGDCYSIRPIRDPILAGVYPDSCVKESLFHASFIRIWSEIEDLSPRAAIRIEVAPEIWTVG